MNSPQVISAVAAALNRQGQQCLQDQGKSQGTGTQFRMSAEAHNSNLVKTYDAFIETAKLAWPVQNYKLI